MTCDCFQIYCTRGGKGVRIRVYVDGQTIVDETAETWEMTFKSVAQFMDMGVKNAADWDADF